MRSENGSLTFESVSDRGLSLLEEVTLTPEVTQMRLACQLGIALGVSDFMDRSLANNSLVRVAHVMCKRRNQSVPPARYMEPQLCPEDLFPLLRCGNSRCQLGT